MGEPWTIFGSDSRNDGDRIDHWGRYIQSLNERNRLPTLRQVLTVDYDDMRAEHYAIAWSLVSYLYDDPDALFAAMYRTRNAQSRETFYEEVLRAYEAEDNELRADWARTIAAEAED